MLKQLEGEPGSEFGRERPRQHAARGDDGTDRPGGAAAAQVELIERGLYKVGTRRTCLQDRSKFHAPREVPDTRNGDVVPLVIKGRPEFKRGERLLRVTRIVTERTTVLVIALCLSQCVVRDQIGFMESTLAIAN